MKLKPHLLHDFTFHFEKQVLGVTWNTEEKSETERTNKIRQRRLFVVRLPATKLQYLSRPDTTKSFNF